MKKGRQIFLRKFLAVFLSISMIFGLLPGNLTVALAEESEENPTITGFVAVCPEWNENGEPSFPTKPDYMTELGKEVQGARSDLYFGFIDELGQFKKITDVSKITAGEGLKITKQTNESGNESEDLFTVSFCNLGQHTLTYNDETKNNTIKVNVVENRIKIYEDVDHNRELARDAWGSYLWDNDDMGHSAECKEVYVVIKPNDGEVINKVEPFVFSGGTGKLSIEELTDQGNEYEYKITRTEGSISCDPFSFKITGHMSEDAGNTFEQEIQLCVHFQGAGLRVTSELERDEYGNVTGVADGAAWDVAMGCDINGTEACFGIVDANGSYQKKVTADQLEIYEAHEEDGAIIPDTDPTENASITQNDNEEWVSLHFKKEGVYVIQLKNTDDPDNNKVDVWVSMPNVGFYSRPEISADAYLAGDVAFGKQDGDNVLYLIAKDDDDAAYNQAKEAVFSCDGNSSEAVCNLFIDVEKITVANAAKAYKVTIKKNKNFHLEAHCEYQTQDPQGTFDNYARNLSLQYQGDQPDQGQEEAPNGLWRYEGEDGEDYIGYSGRYITEEAYLKGTIWFEDATPESICYWVHGKTIQEVVDKLLELEDQNVTVWDSVEEKETEVTIHNSGFIYLNMSYRDSRYKAAVEAEQYVYAPASVKGVMLDTASNSYSVTLTSPDGSVHQDKENDNKPIYDTVYEFPLTKAAQSSMKQYDLAGNESKVEYDSTGNDGIQYLHGIVLQDWYLSEEDGYGNKLKKLLELQNDANKNLGEDQQSFAKRIIQKTIYDASTDSWRQTGTYYLISDNDINPDNDEEHHVEQYAVFQKEQHRWPSLHVNASTQVRVLGLWTNDAHLYIGFYDGVDSVSTYIGKDDEGRDIASFSPKDIGKTKKVTYSCRSVEYDPSLKRNGDEKTNEDNHVTVHIVKAESNTKINDTYSEGGKSASIDVEKEAISDLVPMTNDEKEALIDGASLDLELKVSGVENSADADVVKAQQDIKSVLGSNKKADFFNAFLNYTLKKSDGTAVADNKMITEAEEEMVLSFPLKEALQGKKNYVVYRYHDGKAEKLNAWIDKTTGNLCFETDRFSVYAIAVDDETSGGSSSGGGSASGGGSSAGGGTVVNPDNKTEDTKTEVKPDGTRVETKTDTVKNDQGNEVKSETTTIKNADGTVASVTTTIEIKDAATNTTINMVVKKDAADEVTEAKAEIEAVAAAGKNGKAKTTLNADAAEQMIQAAGTKNVTIKQTVRDDKGNTLYTVETDAKNLEAGRKLTLVEIREGKQILVAKSAKVDTNGNFTIRAPKGEYQLLNETQMKTLRKQILATVKPAKKSVSIKKGKKAAISLSKKLDKANVAKITYRSTKKSVVTITKNGKATGKKKGAAVIEITVVLNDGTKKVIKTKVTVK